VPGFIAFQFSYPSEDIKAVLLRWQCDGKPGAFSNDAPEVAVVGYYDGENQSDLCSRRSAIKYS